MSDLEPMDPEMRALLQRAAPELGAPDAAKARVQSALMASLAAPPAAQPRGLDAPSASAQTTATVSLSKAIGAAIVAFAVGGATGAALIRVKAPEARIVYVDRPVPAFAQPSPAPSVPVVPVDQLASVPAPQPDTPALASSLVQERKVLDEARSQFAQGSMNSCLAILARHEKLYPRGALSEERDALFVRALSGAGRHEEASRRAQRFAERYAESLLLPAVRAAVERRD